MTVPSGLSTGNNYEGVQWGDGQVQVVAGGGVDIDSGTGSTTYTYEKASVFSLKCLDTDDYLMYGNLELE